MKSSRVGGWDLVDWLERHVNVATILGSIQASSDTAESEGRQIKQFWIKYFKKSNKSPVDNLHKFIFKKLSDGRVCVGLPEVELRCHNLQKLETTRLQKFVSIFLAPAKKYNACYYCFQTEIFNLCFFQGQNKMILANFQRCVKEKKCDLRTEKDDQLRLVPTSSTPFMFLFKSQRPDNQRWALSRMSSAFL